MKAVGLGCCERTCKAAGSASGIRRAASGGAARPHLQMHALLALKLCHLHSHIIVMKQPMTVHIVPFLRICATLLRVLQWT